VFLALHPQALVHLDEALRGLSVDEEGVVRFDPCAYDDQVEEFLIAVGKFKIQVLNNTILPDFGEFGDVVGMRFHMSDLEIVQSAPHDVLETLWNQREFV